MPHKTYKTLFFGTPDFAVPVLETLSHMDAIDLVGVFTQPDKPVGRKQILTPPPVKQAAAKLSLPIFQPTKMKDEKLEQQLRQLEPDVVIIIAYGKIIPQPLLTIPKHGWVNVHASLLPKHRGASPIQAALLAGDATTGVTLMQIDAGLDTGPMISKKEITIASHETFATLHDKLNELGADLVQETLVPYLTGAIQLQEQNNDDATECGTITKEDGKIDWSLSANVIDRQVRAYTPWPGAYTQWDGKRLLIHKATVADNTIAVTPGTIKRLGDTILVGTGSSVMQIGELQLEGKKKQTAADFLRGHSTFTQAKLV